MLHHIHRPVAACGGRPGDLAVRHGNRHVLASGPDRDRRHGIGTNRLVERFARLHRNTWREVSACMRNSGFCLVNQAAGKSAGIADVVDDPDPHIALLGLFGELLEEGEVLRRQIGVVMPPPACTVTAWKPRLLAVSRSCARLSMVTAPFSPK